MSGKIMGAVWDMDLPQAQKFVLLAYADHADHEGRGVRPSYGLIAWKTGYTKRHVMRITAELESAGILVLDEPGAKNAPGRSNKANEWHINVEAVPKSAPRKLDKSEGIVTPASPGSDTGVTRVMTPMSPQPSIEPSIEPEPDSSFTDVQEESGAPSQPPKVDTSKPKTDKGNFYVVRESVAVGPMSYAAAGRLAAVDGRVSQSPEDRPVEAPSKPPPEPARVFKAGDRVTYRYRHGWGGGGESEAASLVLSVTAKKAIIVVEDMRLDALVTVNTTHSTLRPRIEHCSLDNAFEQYAAAWHAAHDKAAPKARAPRPRDKLFDLVLLRSFQADPRRRTSGKLYGGRVGPICAALRDQYGRDDNVLRNELRRAYRWHCRLRDENGEPLKPCSGERSVVDLIKRYRQAKEAENGRSTNDDEARRSPGFDWGYPKSGLPIMRGNGNAPGGAAT